MDKRCGTCARGARLDDGHVACGAAVDETTVQDPDSANPIWAIRKYGSGHMGVLVAALLCAQQGMPSEMVCLPPDGSDAEFMPADDGLTCNLWQPDPYLEDDGWEDITALGSSFETQFNPENGLVRHRPLRACSLGHSNSYLRSEDPWSPGPPPAERS